MKTIASILFDRFPELARRLPEAAGKAVKKTLDEMDKNVRAGMNASMPPPSSPGQMPAIRTAELINSLVKDMDSETSGTYSAGTNGTAPYAVFLEYGTSRMAPRPFMTPAAELGRKVLEDEMKKIEKELT